MGEIIKNGTLKVKIQLNDEPTGWENNIHVKLTCYFHQELQINPRLVRWQQVPTACLAVKKYKSYCSVYVRLLNTTIVAICRWAPYPPFNVGSNCRSSSAVQSTAWTRGAGGDTVYCPREVDREWFYITLGMGGPSILAGIVGGSRLTR